MRHFVLATLLATGCATVTVHSPERRTERHLAAIRDTPSDLAMFLRAMPKGGDLHIHLSGAVYAESYLRWAAQDGVCLVRPPEGAPSLASPPCDSARHAAPYADVLAQEPGIHDVLIDAFSMRNWNGFSPSGHDHFFATFDRFDARRERNGDMAAEVVARLARQNTWYVELMGSLGVGSAGNLGDEAGWSDDLATMRARLPQQGIDRVVSAARMRLDAQEARMRTVLRCGTPSEDPGCRVTVRYIVSLVRTVPRQSLFASLVAAATLIEVDPRVVALNLVAPEDHPVALRDYHDHMRSVAFVTAGRRVKVTLHAGELTPTLVTPEDASFHVRDAVRVAGAQRIGHGTDIVWEEGSADTLAEMARRGIAVEVCLTSADVILGVRGHDHPFEVYRRAGVPIVLATDDEGVARSDLTREYLRAVRTYRLSWADLKTLARNAVRYSFLDGESLWTRSGPQREIVAACAGARLSEAPPPPCQAFLARSERAREEWRVERRLHDFEQQW